MPKPLASPKRAGRHNRSAVRISAPYNRGGLRFPRPSLGFSSNLPQETQMAKKQNTFAKRQREQEKKQKAERKRIRRQTKTDEASTPDDRTALGPPSLER